MFCHTCKGDGGFLINPDYPMGDCGDREWMPCPDECGTPSRKDRLWEDHLLQYGHERFGSPLPERLQSTLAHVILEP